MTDTASAAPSEREKFEAWLPPYWPRETYRDDEGDELFRDSWVQGAWMGWQGRAAQPTPPAVVEPLEPVVSNVDGINERIQFRRGWRAAEAAHGIGIKNGGRAQDEALIRQMVMALETAP